MDASKLRKGSKRSPLLRIPCYFPCSQGIGEAALVADRASASALSKLPFPCMKRHTTPAECAEGRGRHAPPLHPPSRAGGRLGQAGGTPAVPAYVSISI